MAIGLGVIGMNPTNMGSTATLLKDVPRSQIRTSSDMCQKGGCLRELCGGDWGRILDNPTIKRWFLAKILMWLQSIRPITFMPSTVPPPLKRGSTLICTKPMVTDLEDAKRLVGLVREKGVKFLVGQTMRFDLQFQTMRRFFDDGELGEIMAADAYYVHDMRPVYDFTPWRLHEPQDLMFGGVVHPVDILRSFLGDVEEVHAYGAKGKLTPEYPIMNNFFLNLKFAGGQIARAMGLYDIVHPPMPMMQVSIYGTGGTMIGDFTDNKGGQVKLILDKLAAKEPLEMTCPPEVDTSVYGHGQTVIRYMRHFQNCIEEDTEPSPNAVDGAKSVAVGVAAWESIRTGQPVKVFNDF